MLLQLSIWRGNLCPAARLIYPLPPLLCMYIPPRGKAQALHTAEDYEASISLLDRLFPTD